VQPIAFIDHAHHRHWGGKGTFFPAPSEAVCQQYLKNSNQNYQNNLLLPKSFWLWMTTHFL